MNRAPAKFPRIKPPAGLAKLFADPPLVGDETREEYDSFFQAISSAAKPADAIAWLFVYDIATLSWEIRRERKLKLQVLKSAQEEEVRALLTPREARTWTLKMDWVPDVDPKVEKITNDIAQRLSDPKVRRRELKALADKGYDASYILTRALNASADRVDAIDRRIASYELRRMAAIRAIEHYSETLARRLEVASSKIIDGEFSEAAE